MPTIELQFKEKPIGNYPIGAGDTLLIGRNAVNDIVIDNLAVSAQHAKIESIGNGFLFVDLQSENGSFVNDQHIRSHWLDHGDKITVGKHTLIFSNPGDREQEKIKLFGNTKTMRIDTRKFRELLARNQDKAVPDVKSKKNENSGQKEQICVLSYLTGKKQNIQLNAQMTRIGKDPNSDILVKGLRVGKTSAVINKLTDGWHINYVAGISKPRINNRALKKSVKLKNLDIITIGSTKLQFLLFGP
jgi:pSer/pThr/pTyr-binding forkhead associated (FHA) protein